MNTKIEPNKNATAHMVILSIGDGQFTLHPCTFTEAEAVQFQDQNGRFGIACEVVAYPISLADVLETKDRAIKTLGLRERDRYRYDCQQALRRFNETRSAIKAFQQDHNVVAFAVVMDSLEEMPLAYVRDRFIIQGDQLSGDQRAVANALNIAINEPTSSDGQ